MFNPHVPVSIHSCPNQCVVKVLTENQKVISIIHGSDHSIELVSSCSMRQGIFQAEGLPYEEIILRYISNVP